MVPKTFVSSVPLLALACAVAAPAARAEGEALSTHRGSWTADQLYDDFLADFGGDPKLCYTGYTLREVDAPGEPEAQRRRWKKAIVAIDASGSMAGRVGGERKMDAAKAAVRAFLTSVPRDAEVGLLAFGHRGNNEESGKAESCAAVELLAAPGSADAAGIARTLDRVQAIGWTPLAAAIAQAGASFAPAAGEGEQVVFVVSDGVETCGGDPVAAARALRRSDAKAVVDIIGFDIPDAQRKALEAVAEAGGGAFSPAADRKELEERLRVRYANLERRSDYDTAAVTAHGDNNTSALEASSHANTCVLEIVSGEDTRFLEITQRMVENGQTDADAARAARDRLAKRHEALKAEMQSFRERVKAEMKTVNERIDRQRERVRSDYERKE